MGKNVVIVPYNPRLKKLARALRSSSTFGEILLWNKLKGKQLGYRFHRQKPLLEFIADFYCSQLNLVIEVDGSVHTHPTVSKKDFEKEEALKSAGLHILRFSEVQVRFYMNDVLSDIQHYIRCHEERS